MATKAKRPLERTLEWARKLGWPVDRCERFTPSFRKNPDGTPAPGGTRHDLFGFADAIALDGKPGSLALQACGQDLAKHKDKVADNPDLRSWLTAGNRFWIVSWRQVWVPGKKGDTKRQVYQPRVVDVRWYRDITYGQAIEFYELDLAEALAGKEG